MSRPIRIRVSGSRQRYAVLAAGALVATMAVAPATGSAVASPLNDVASSSSTVDTSRALVQLSAEPLATYVRTRPAPGKKIDFSSSTVKSYRALLTKARNDYKTWLRKNVPGARVSGEFDISLNAVSVQLNGASLAQVSATPMVRTAQYEGVYYPTAEAAVDPDLALINAVSAWGEGGSATAGEGVKVAIVDTGIDVDHPCFSDAGYAQQTRKGEVTYTNNKVIVARVFNNKLNQNGFDAKAVGDHGTHVAGTVACNFETPATVNGVAIPYGISGVAPRALLGNYNVFPGTVENARSEDILNALEAAYADGMDVVNMSLGGGSHGIQDLLTIAVDNLDRADMVVAVSAGNEGPNPFTIGSPGMAERALTAGASSVGHFIGATVTVNDEPYGAASGDFAVLDPDGPDLNAKLGVVLASPGVLGTACSALPAASLTGKIALISRGACTFSTKIRNAQDAGAVAVLVVNIVAGDPTAMAEDGTANQPTVPAYMVSNAYRSVLMEADGADTTIGAALSYVSTPNSNIMAGFSSQGPVDVSLRVKPDVVAPGVNVLSSIPMAACDAPPCFAFFSGTSMASPHLAGSAAVVLQQHPDWSAAEVRSAIVNTADQGVLKNYVKAKPTNNVLVVGAGLENLDAAVQAQVSLDPVSVAFGGVPSGSGQMRTQTVTVTNLSGSPATYAFAVTDQPTGVDYSVSRDTLDLLAGESATVTVTAKATAGAATGPQQAFLQVKSGGSEIAHAVLFTWVK